MSTIQNSREVAYRLFAAEFEDATLSYSAGDDERAPNYVVTPTGERINRLFTVGALTAVESVTDDLRRGRIADPTGVFVTYAGQYQPTAASFLEQATPPMFVALTAKARTYQPEDSDQVLTSARPEDLTAVDTDTRDRWAVSAAQATLRRIGIMDIAQSLSVRGDALESELESRGVDEARAEGMALAIDHYGTTEFYLESLRKTVIQVLEVIAGNRETVKALDTNPSETGSASLGALPSIAIDTTSTSTSTSSSVSEGIQDSAHNMNNAVDDNSVATESDTDTTVITESSPSQETTVDTDIVQPAADGESTVESASEPDEYVTSDPITPENDGENGVTAEAENATADDSLSADVTEDSAPSDEMTETIDTTQDTNSTETHLDTEIQREVDESEISTDTENTSAPTSASNSDIVSSDEEIDIESGNSDESTVGSADTDDNITADPTEMYELDDDERAEIEDEFVTEFSTGNEVDAPGSADIDVPTAPDEDPSDEETSVDATTNATETASIDTDSTDGEPHETPIESDTDIDTDIAVDDISESSPAGSGDLGDFETAVDFDSESTESNSSAGKTRSNQGETESGTETSAESTNIADSDETQDVDLEQAAVSMMSELDDGDGATREAVIDEVVDMHDVSPDAVESAIQSALMSGRCYESGENVLKAI